MSTVAADRHMMVSDQQESDISIKRKTTKIFRVKGDIVGYVGDIALGQIFVKWYGNRKTDITHYDFSDFEALALTPTGLYRYLHTLIPERVSPPFAIGSGTPYVLASIHNGSNLITAVKTAMHFDLYSGHGLHILRLRK